MTPNGLMRTLLPSRLLHLRPAAAAINAAGKNGSSNTAVRIAGNALRQTCDPRSCLLNCRCFAHVNDIDTLNRDVYFTPSLLRPQETSLNPGPGQGDHQPPDERTLQLGRTVRILHDRLPTLLQTPLPSEILSPQISLHLFPSTHPHLPTVSGRIAYIAALWTAPVAWGRLPLIGNVKLTILSERMVRNGASGAEEKLIVKWKTCGKTRHRDSSGGIYNSPILSSKDPYDKIRDFIAGTSKPSNALPAPNNQDEEGEKSFHGLFVFEFDSRGRIAKHVIERTEEGGHWDRMPRVVSVTDWLLGRFNGRGRESEQVPELAWCQERPTGGRIRIVDRSGGGEVG